MVTFPLLLVCVFVCVCVWASDVVARMAAELKKQAATIFSVPHKQDPECLAYADAHYGGFYGPWKEV